MEESEPPTPQTDSFINYGDRREEDNGNENGANSRYGQIGEGRYGLGFEGVVATPVTFVPERSISNPEPIPIASRQYNDLLRSSSRAPPPAHIFPSTHTSLRVKLDPNPPPHRHSRQDDSGNGNEDVADDYDDDETAVLKITDGRDIGKVEEGMYLRSKLWWLGMVLIAVGEGGNFLSYGFAPASVVAPLGTVVCPFLPPDVR